MESESLKAAEAMSAANATAPRVSLESMEAKIVGSAYWQPLDTTLTVCILRMENGFHVVGESASASAENFDAELVKKFAYENAIRKLWQLEGYALRDRLAAAEKD